LDAETQMSYLLEHVFGWLGEIKVLDVDESIAASITRTGVPISPPTS
jgi:hypothetical protein